MAKSKTPAKKKPTKLKINKRALWFKFYTDPTNPVTFLNKTQSAKAAMYKCKTEESFHSVGYENFTKLESEVAKKLDATVFSESALTSKHSELLEARKTAFHKVKGKVNGEDLPEGVRIIAQSDRMSVAGQGEESFEYDDGETLLAINVVDPEVQRKSLDMAYKVKGTYAAEERKHSGAVGVIPMTDFPPEPKTIEEWERDRKVSEKKLLVSQS